MAVKLADALDSTGGSVAIIGSLRALAGQPRQAFPSLMTAALEARARQASGEAFHLAEAALAAAAEAGIGEPSEIGTLHLICAEFLRSAGRTEWAARHLEEALADLDGPQRIEALRLAATAADDSQRPQLAESTVAMAEYEALRAGESVTYGSLLSLRARALHRIGFAMEADAALARALELSQDDPENHERFQAMLNKAWIHFDRGEAGLAEIEFTRLRDQARSVEGEASVADKEAWRARALFASGHPDDAVAAIAHAEEIALREGVEAPLFLAQLALAEGNLAFGRPGEALKAAEEALDLVERQLPAWENMVRSHRAAALLALGRSDEALVDINRALELTPPGADGFRWRLRCRALRLEIAAACGEKWSDDEAEDVADQLLQARLYGWAAELLSVLTERGGRSEAAREALAIAQNIGQPMLAVRAADAGSLWGAEAAIPTILSVRAISHRLPDDWEQTWSTLSGVVSAMGAPEPEESEETLAASAAMDQALRDAGLADIDTMLSPAQRRSSGLVRQRRPRRRIWAIAAALGIVVLAAGTAFGVTQLTAPDETIPEAATGTTQPAPDTTLPSLEETQIPIENERGFLFGTAELRGDLGRSGFVDVAGPRSISGHYWKVRTGGAIDATPVAFGQQLFVGSTEGTFYAFDQSTGDEIWTLAPEGRVSTAAAIGQAAVGEGRTPEVMVIADDAGVVRAHQAGITAAAPWSTQLDGRIRSAPIIVDGEVIVATSEGFLYGLDLIEGDVLWTYPTEGEGLGAVSADMAYNDGLVYVGTQDGFLHIVDVSAEVPETICSYDARDPIAVNPIVVDGVVY
ncbi:MAG: PQQ-binding-like beta-propeller repeat protein, partial [Acidimicrobiia bacterium]